MILTGWKAFREARAVVESVEPLSRMYFDTLKLVKHTTHAQDNANFVRFLISTAALIKTKQGFGENVFLTKNLIICPPSEMIDKLGVYAEVGIDEIIISAGFGQSQEDLIESMYRISDQIIPFFNKSDF